MKSCYLLALPKRMQAAVLAIGTLLLASCAIGYDGSGTFSSGVSDSQLASPSADDITFTPNVSGTEVTITWPVVMGAGGYEVSFYNMNDPDNPVAVGDENEVIDGCSTTRAIAEDTQYEFRIRALENTEYGNIGAESPTIAEYDTYVPSVGTIPSGTDLATYFADFSSTEVSPTEVAYELEAGGNYTMTGNVDFDRHWLTLRGDRNDPPTVTIIGDAKFTMVNQHGTAVAPTVPTSIIGQITTDVTVYDTLDNGEIVERIVEDSVINDTLINKESSLSTFKVPLSYSDQTTFIINYNGEQQDYITIKHRNIPYFMSVDCGTMMFYEVTGAESTTRMLDSLVITNPNIDNNEKENFKIYFTIAADAE